MEVNKTVSAVIGMFTKMSVGASVGAVLRAATPAALKVGAGSLLPMAGQAILVSMVAEMAVNHVMAKIAEIKIPEVEGEEVKNDGPTSSSD